MDKFFHSRIFRCFVCLLLVSLFVINCSPIRADAITVGTAISVSSVALAAAALYGLGLSAKDGDYTAFNHIVSDCVTWLETAAIVGLKIVDGSIALPKSDSGITYVRKNILESIVDWLFSSNTISSNPTSICPVSFTNPIGESFSVSMYNSSDDFDVRVAYYIQAPGSSIYYFSTLLYSPKRFTISKDGSSTNYVNQNTRLENNDLYYYFTYHVQIDKTSSFLSLYPHYDRPYSALQSFAPLDPSVTMLVPDGIAVSDVAPKPGEAIATTYPGWAAGEQTLTDDDAIAVPYWPIAVPAYDVLNPAISISQADVWAGAVADSEAGSVTDTLPWAPSAEMGHFTLDLKQFFPFCIPFDLYDFFTCLNADPVAPVINWVIPMPGGAIYPLEIDLSPFNSVAQLLRRLQLLVFCVGLAFKTRDLIKG